MSAFHVAATAGGDTAPYNYGAYAVTTTTNRGVLTTQQGFLQLIYIQNRLVHSVLIGCQLDGEETHVRFEFDELHKAQQCFAEYQHSMGSHYKRPILTTCY